jgi:hypothetical protein
MEEFRMKRGALLALALGLGLAPGAFAQTAGGNIYGTVADESGAVLPGANVTLAGPVGTRNTTSTTQGEFRFLNVDPGNYKLTVGLSGFSNVAREVQVNTGANVNLAFTLKVTGVEETVTVTAETPIVDTKKVGTGTTLTREELHQVPNSRDPWAVLRTIPGVVVDRVNIAGNESGQQSNFTGKGASPNDVMWNLDGVVITDMAAIGASPTYFDYDAFDEVNVTTGGGDLKVATGGIGLNFVTKRGTNSFHGALRGYFTHKDLQTSNIPDELQNDSRLCLTRDAAGACTSFSDKADHIDQIADYGFDLGGPIVKDKLWFWGSWGKQDIRNVRTNQTKDKTLLKDFNGKINWQASDSDMVSAFWFLGAKEKYGRAVGFIGNESDEFLWNQGGIYPSDTFKGLFKLENNHVFSPSFFTNIKLAYYGTGFGFTPRGETAGSVNYRTQTTAGTSYYYATLRPQYTASLDGNYFFSGMGGNNELKFGFGYRKTPIDSTTSFVGPTRLFGFKRPNGIDYALVTRDRKAAYETAYTNAYLGDTFTKDRLTLNVGVRWDRQKGGNRESTAEANAAFPNLLPQLDFPGTGRGVNWSDFSPRASASYALDEARKTVLRASYANYAGQLSASEVAWDNPLGSVSYLAYLWSDGNNDGVVQPAEVRTDLGLQYYGFVDPANPGSATSTNDIDPDYKANRDQEFIVGIDRELFANFAVSAAYTYRHGTDIGYWTPRIGMTTADYRPGTPSTSRGFTAQAFSPDPARVAAAAGGRILMNRPDYTRNYNGLEITLMKRLSNRWMGRAAFSWMDWTENYEGPNAIQNPTLTDVPTQGTIGGFAGPGVDGGQVVLRSAGSGKGDIFYTTKWQFIANGLVQLPWSIELAGSLYGRQGYPRPVVEQLGAGLDGTLRVMAFGAATVPATGQSVEQDREVDDVRYPNLWNLDLRLAKNVKIAGGTSLQLVADLFNALNNDVELNRVRTANSAAFNRLDEVLSPRVVRFGVRLQF